MAVNKNSEVKNKNKTKNKINKSIVGLNKTNVTKKKGCVLVFCAHPDDEVIGVGGTLKKFADEGVRTVVVIFTGGEKSNALYKKERLIEIRHKETMAAAKVLKISEVINLGLNDMHLSKDVELESNLKRIKDIILKEKPSKIFTHAIDDVLYQDHKAVHDSVFKIVKNLNKEHKVNKSEQKFSLYTFNVWTLNFRKRDTPKLVIDISNEFEFKLDALKKFKSQKLALIQLYPFIYGRAIFAGWKHDAKYVEEFYKVL